MESQPEDLHQLAAFLGFWSQMKSSRAVVLCYI